MSFGVIFCSYSFPELLYKSIGPWITLKDELDIKIVAVHGQFREYHDFGFKDDDSDTEWQLNELYRNKKIDYLYIQNPSGGSATKIYQTEFEIRDKALQWLLTQDVDYLWLVDSDEVITVEEIRKTAEFVKNNPLTCWFTTEFKNLTFDILHYTEGFRPPRIFSVNYNQYKLNKCIYDNEFSYKGNGDIVNHRQFPSLNVPKNRFFALHYTWLNNQNSKNKILYHEKRWYYPDKGNGCSFKWNNEKDCLEFNLDYFKRINQSPPEVLEIKND